MKSNRSQSSGRRFVKNMLFSLKNRLLRLKQLTHIGTVFFWKSRVFLKDQILLEWKVDYRDSVRKKESMI